MRSQTSLVATQIRLQQWAEDIHACQNRPADMKIETWCSQNGITKANYYYRLRKVREACLLACDDSNHSFVELSVSENNSPSQTASVTTEKVAAILHMSNGISLELYNSASYEFIKKILEASAYAQ